MGERADRARAAELAKAGSLAVNPQPALRAQLATEAARHESNRTTSASERTEGEAAGGLHSAHQSDIRNETSGAAILQREHAADQSGQGLGTLDASLYAVADGEILALDARQMGKTSAQAAIARPAGSFSGSEDEDSGRARQLAALKPYQFKPGNSGSGKGHRKQLTDRFLKVLRADFEEHGADAVAKARKKRPMEYVRVVANLLPKQIDIREGVLEDANAEEIEHLIDMIQSALRGERLAPMLAIEGHAQPAE